MLVKHASTYEQKEKRKTNFTKNAWEEALQISITDIVKQKILCLQATYQLGLYEYWSIARTSQYFFHPL